MPKTHLKFDLEKLNEDDYFFEENISDVLTSLGEETTDNISTKVKAIVTVKHRPKYTGIDSIVSTKIAGYFVLVTNPDLSSYTIDDMNGAFGSSPLYLFIPDYSSSNSLLESQIMENIVGIITISGNLQIFAKYSTWLDFTNVTADLIATM